MDYSKYIERYLDGIMSDTEKVWFEKELEGNSELQLDLELFRKTNQVILEKEIIELKTQLNSIHEMLKEEKEKKLKIKPKVFAGRVLLYASGIAASVIIAVLITMNIDRSYSNEQLYNMFYEPYESNISFRSSETNVDDELNKAMALYENRQYEEAIVIFENILSQDSTRMGVNLYSGISHMEIEQYKEANKKFNKVIEHENIYKESAEWYLGFCYLMTSEREKAVETYETIAAGNGYYSKDAKKVLRKLN